MSQLSVPTLALHCLENKKTHNIPSICLTLIDGLNKSQVHRFRCSICGVEIYMSSV